ncbi:MAG: phenylalanine--tRNA ligase subunit alpha [Candidatus Andersenbacteria bacterium]
MAAPIPRKERVADAAALGRAAKVAIADAADVAALEKIRLTYLGRKGSVTLALRSLKDLSDEQKRAVGPALNALRAELDAAIAARAAELTSTQLAGDVAKETIDVTAPVVSAPLGHLHPTEQVRREVEDVFRSMGFEVVRGQEIDDDENNFELLNIPPDHPARDMWATFWLKRSPQEAEREQPGQLLLRTHTSNMQVRVMRQRTPPIRVVNIGRVYRYEATDRTHETNFHQIEGFMVDDKTTMADLQGTLQALYEAIFGQKLKTRFRPSYFPFTEPSVELDISCVFCTGAGCSVCSKTGWLEAGGAGMVHPTVLKNAGYDPRKVQGWAFGMGLDRITMFKFGIDDVRLLMAGDLRFLEQF